MSLKLKFAQFVFALTLLVGAVLAVPATSAAQLFAADNHALVSGEDGIYLAGDCAANCSTTG